MKPRNLMDTFSTTRKHGKKAIRSVAAAILMAGVASAALVAPVSAAPIDQFTISPYGAWSHFGTSCVIAGPPAGNATLDWNLNAAGTTVRPRMTGQICIQDSSGVNARMKLEYYDPNWVLIGTTVGGVATGNGGLHVANVDLQSSTRFSSAYVYHVRAVLLDDRALPGTFAVVGTSAEWL